MDNLPNTILIYKQTRIYVPYAAREKLLEIIHLSHQGEVKSQFAAKSRYFWIGMNHNIEQMCENCTPGRELRKLQPKDPFITLQLTRTLSPMESVLTDLFEYKKLLDCKR